MNDTIPFIDLKAQYEGIRGDVRAAVDRVFESQQFILGDEVTAFEAALADRLGVNAQQVVGVSSGTDALLMSLMALGVGPGDRVLTTPFSFFATAGVISRLQAIPEFLDIDPVTFNMDPSQLSDRDATRYKGVIVAHMFGRSAAMEPILEWASRGSVPVIEDAAQAIGSTTPDGRPCGGVGTLGCFSFFPTKNLGGAGDGGAVVAEDEDVAGVLRQLRVHGATQIYENRVVGGNFRLDAIQAAVLGVKLAHLDQWNMQRAANARLYNELLGDAGLGGKLGLPPLTDDDSWNGHQYVLRCPLRDELRESLGNGGIGSAVYYPTPFHLMGAFDELGYTEGSFPEAEKACQEVLALPIFPELGEDRLRRVCGAISAFYRDI